MQRLINHTNRYFFSTLTIIIICIVSFNARAEKTVTIGIYDYKPLVFKDKDGTFQGIYIDILNYISKIEKWNIVYVYGTWQEGIQRLDSRQIDLIVAISSSEERREKYDFNNEPVLTNRGQIYKQNNLKIESINDLRDKKIAIFKNDIFATEFKKLMQIFDIHCDYVEVDDYQSVYELINDKKVHVGVANNVSWLYNDLNTNVSETPIIFLPTSLLFAAPKNAREDYLKIIDSYLSKMKDLRSSEYYRIIDKWTINQLDIVSSKKNIPRWIIYGLFSGGVFTFMFFSISLFLKKQIKNKTEEIIIKNEILATEIVRKKEIADKLKLHKKKLVDLMDNLPGMVYQLIINEKWHIGFVSTGCIKLLGYHDSFFYEEKDIIFKKLIHPEDFPYVAKEIENAKSSNLVYHLIYRIKTNNGVYKWVSDQGKITCLDKNGHMECEGFISDVTQQQESEIQLRKENSQLRVTMRDRYKFRKIIGKCEAMQKVYELIIKASTSNESVSIYGETGTGKELVARAIHEGSDRQEGPFVVVNCSAISEELIESEFFGHVKGAFTGAYKDRKGFLEIANSGTLFLDEIGDISLSTQVKLLRAIENGEYTPVGSTKTFTSDFRIITASNKNLKNLVEQGAMRQDFYYRIHVIPIDIPPLRERKEDIPLLADFFMEQYGKDFKLSVTGNILESMLDYNWPGNVREFQNKINRFAVLKEIQWPNSSPAMPKPNSSSSIVQESNLKNDKGQFHTLKRAISIFEKNYIQTLLSANNWHRAQVAKLLDINRKTLFIKMKNYGLIK